MTAARLAYCHPDDADAQLADSCTRTASEKGGAGQALTLAVSTAPELPAGTLAAKGAAASGPAACWLAGLTSAPAAAAPSVPRLTTVPPASPNVYQSSGARQPLGGCDCDGDSKGEALAVLLEDGKVLAEALVKLGERVRDGEAVLLDERVSDGERLGEAALLVLLDGEEVLLALLDGEAEDEGVGQAAAMCAAAVEALSGTRTTRPPYRLLARPVLTSSGRK